MTTRKVVAAVHGPLRGDAPDGAWLRAYAVYEPHPDEPAKHPADVGGIVAAWVDAESLPDGIVLDTLAEHFDAPLDAYLVDERVQIDWQRDWSDGTSSPGVRQISFVRRLPTITRDEMAEHWGEVHAPLARVHHPAVWRYVQNVVDEALTQDAPEVDGIAELHFRSLDDMHERFYDSPDGKAIIADDVRRFLDRGAGWRMIARETWVRS